MHPSSASHQQPLAGPMRPANNTPGIPSPTPLLQQLPSTTPDVFDFESNTDNTNEGIPNSMATAMLALHDQPLLMPSPSQPNQHTIHPSQPYPPPSSFNQLIENFDPSSIRVILNKRHIDANSPLYSVSRFEDLDLYANQILPNLVFILTLFQHTLLHRPKALLRGLYSVNYNKPSKIQEHALPLLLSDPPRNLIGQSQSGTGKTAAFVITMLKRLDFNPSASRHPQSLCIVNTRELALQIVHVITQIGVHMTGLQVGLATGGSPAPMLGTHVIVGTPGRVLDLCQRRTMDLSQLKVFVVDEADVMLNTQNFKQQISTLLHSYIRPPSRQHSAQMILFSATLNDDRVMRFATQFAPDANLITLETNQIRVDSIIQFALPIANTGVQYKCKALLDLYALLNVGQSIVFVERKETAYVVAQFLVQHDHEVAVLTSNDEFSVRDDIMARFRLGLVKVLISTNVLSRGIDVPQVNLVVNFDLPMKPSGHPNYENYIHRVGRTGRFGRAGVAINFLDGPDSEYVMEAIVKHYGMRIHRMPNDFEQMEKLLKDVQVL